MDVFDALTTDRPYRKALAWAEALAILAEETRKGWWDPSIAEAFMALVERRASTSEGAPPVGGVSR